MWGHQGRSSRQVWPKQAICSSSPHRAGGPEGTIATQRCPQKPTFSPRRDKALLEGSWARWHLPGLARNKEPEGWGRGWLAGRGPSRPAHTPSVWLEPCQAGDRHLGMGSAGPGARGAGRGRQGPPPQARPWRPGRPPQATPAAALADRPASGASVGSFCF